MHRIVFFSPQTYDATPLVCTFYSREIFMSLRINRGSLVPCQVPAGQWSSCNKFHPNGTQVILASPVHCPPPPKEGNLPAWSVRFRKVLLIIPVAGPGLVLTAGCRERFLKCNGPQPVKEFPSPLLISCHMINSSNVMPHANTLIRSYLMKSKRRLSSENICLWRNSKQIGENM